MLIRSRAPVRIDFAGGWTDVALFTRDAAGIVVNAAIQLYSFATLKQRRNQQIIDETNSDSKRKKKRKN